jgi:hypothetical protein
MVTWHAESWENSFICNNVSSYVMCFEKLKKKILRWPVTLPTFESVSRLTGTEMHRPLLRTSASQILPSWMTWSMMLLPPSWMTKLLLFRQTVVQRASAHDSDAVLGHGLAPRFRAVFASWAWVNRWRDPDSLRAGAVVQNPLRS